MPQNNVQIQLKFWKVRMGCLTGNVGVFLEFKMLLELKIDNLSKYLFSTDVAHFDIIRLLSIVKAIKRCE